MREENNKLSVMKIILILSITFSFLFFYFIPIASALSWSWWGGSTDRDWLYNQTAGTLNQYGKWWYNQTLGGSSIFVDITGDTMTGLLTLGNGLTINGTTNINGGWLNNGTSFINGDIFAQTLYQVNVTELSVEQLIVNGSIIPPVAFTNQFDLGSPSATWQYGYFGTDVIINGVNVAPWLYNQSYSGGTYNSTYESYNTNFGKYWYNYTGTGSYYYNQTTASNLSIVTAYGKWFYNMSDGSYNISYQNYAYNMSDGSYNATYSGAIYNDSNANLSNLNVSNRFAVNGSAFYVGSNGKVGIGTGSPGANLHLFSGTNVNPETLRINSWGLNSYYTDIINNAGSSGDTYFNNYGGAGVKAFYFQHNTATKMTLREGSLGILTTTPNYALEVNNNSAGLNVSNNLFVNASSVGIGTSTPVSNLNILDLDTATTGADLYILNVTASRVFSTTKGNLTGIYSSISGNGVAGGSGQITGYAGYFLARTGGGASGGTGTGYALYANASDAGTGTVSTTNYGIYATAEKATTNWAGYFDSGNVYINNNLSIGTKTILGKLNINGSDMYFGDTSNTNREIIFRRNGATVGSIGTGNSKLNFYGGATAANHLVIDTTGKMGFNISTPSYLFEFNGQTNMILNVSDKFIVNSSTAGYFNGNIKVNENVTLGRKVISTGTAPALSANCGTGATITGGTDFAGTIVTGAGVTSCVATFNQKYTTAPTCVVTNHAGSGNAFTYSATNTALTITLVGALTDTYDYICIGH